MKSSAAASSVPSVGFVDSPSSSLLIYRLGVGDHARFCCGWRCLASCELPRVVVTLMGTRRLAWALCLEVRLSDFFVRVAAVGCVAEHHAADRRTPRRWRATVRSGLTGGGLYGLDQLALESACTAASARGHGPRGVCRPPDAVPPHKAAAAPAAVARVSQRWRDRRRSGNRRRSPMPMKSRGRSPGHDRRRRRGRGRPFEPRTRSRAKSAPPGPIAAPAPRAWTARRRRMVTMPSSRMPSKLCCRLPQVSSSARPKLRCSAGRQVPRISCRTYLRRDWRRAARCRTLAARLFDGAVAAAVEPFPRKSPIDSTARKGPRAARYLRLYKLRLRLERAADTCT